jgi:polyisoprenoid-binding protein YceI
MRRIILFSLPIAAVAGIAGASVAAQGTRSGLPGARDLARVTSGTYATDPNHTLIGWEVNHFGFNDYFGQFGMATGTLVLDKAAPANSRVDITIPINSLTAASAGLVRHMSTADFFDVANNPTARFVSTRVIIDANDPKEAVIEGNLTIKGVTRPVRLEAEFTGAGTNPMNNKQTIGFEAETTIRRSEFGVAYALPVVSDEVKLNISVAFEKQ